MASNKIKKLLSFVLTLVMVFSVMPQKAMAYDYTGHWAEDNIKDLLAKNIISANALGDVNTEEYITRGEMFRIINNVLLITDTAEISFKDLAKTDFYVCRGAKSCSRRLCLGL